jgi:hypothetical protein
LTLILREKARQNEFDNRKLRKVSGAWNIEVTGQCRLYNEELHVMYSSPNKILVG